MQFQKPHLITIQPPSQIPRSPHKLLVLVLLHLQLPLSLYADRPHATFRPFPISFLADVHALQESCWDHRWVFLHQGRGVCHVGYFAVLVGGLFDREDGCVGSVLRLLSFCCFRACCQ
jgi:hypothetical protein